MDNEKLKKQMRDMCIAADGLATAMHLFYANVSSDILDDNIAQAVRENSHQENYDRWMDMKRTVETPSGSVRIVDTDKGPKEQLRDILKNGMPDIQVERDPSYDDVSFQAKKLIDDFYATHDRAERLGIAEHILLVMFGLTPDELNEIMEKEARDFNSVISAIQHGNEEATHHCRPGREKCQVGDGSAVVQDPNESQPADTVPESLKELVGMQIVSVLPPGHKCQGCLFDRDYFRCEKKVELVGGYYLCLAPIPIVTE